MEFGAAAVLLCVGSDVMAYSRCDMTMNHDNFIKAICVRHPRGTVKYFIEQP